MTPTSARLAYRRLRVDDVDAFHALLVDPHVLRFLLDGSVVDRAFAREAVLDSDALFASRGVGLFLLSIDSEDVGFAGYRVFPDLGPEPQLLYALREPFTGRGLATEAAEACIRFGFEAGLPTIVAAVDAPNVASIRVLEKLGFERHREWPGAFGTTFGFRLLPTADHSRRASTSRS